MIEGATTAFDADAGRRALLQDKSFLEKVRNRVEGRAARARQSVPAYFEEVMREQTTRRRIRVAPHQQVALDFIMHHDRSLLVWPVGTAKTYTLTGLTLFLLGQDPTTRGAIVSAVQAQSKKVLSVVSDYILHSPEQRAVFGLKPSQREKDPWTQVAITVDRPPGIPDASVYAYGMDGAVAGSRLNWIIVDDLLTRENTATPEQRKKVLEWLDSTVFSRLDPQNARIVFSNSAWHPEDALHVLEKAGWACLRMDILGNIQVQDDEEWMREGRKPWSHPGLRPATDSPAEVNYRLVGHDPDPRNEVPLFPERFFYVKEPAKTFAEAAEMAHADIAHRRTIHLPVEFNRLFLSICRDDSTAMCKREFVQASLAVAQRLDIKGFVSEYTGQNLTFTGLDLAVSPGEEHDDTAFFTFELRPDGTRVILDIDVGQWDGPTILKKVFQKEKAYKSIIRVESNAAQDYLRQFALLQDKSLPIKAHMTGRAKAHPEHGVPGFFLEMANGAWAFPNVKGKVHPAMQRLIDASLYYVPSKHTDDCLMACYFAREMAKEWGVLGRPLGQTGSNGTGNLAMTIMAR